MNFRKSIIFAGILLCASQGHADIYSDIADNIFSQLQPGIMNGLQEHDGLPCSVEFVNVESERPLVKFSYTPRVKSGNFGNEEIEGRKFSGTLGYTLMAASGFLWTTSHHIFLNEDLSSAKGYVIEGGLRNIVRCDLNK